MVAFFHVAVAASLCSRNVASSFSPPSSSLSPRFARSSLSRPPFRPHLRPWPRNAFGLRSTNNNELITSLLDKDAAGDGDPHSGCTHQIAIPLGDAPELHTALSGVQASLVADCPRLVRACVVPALLRLPLLYVDGRSAGAGGAVGAAAGVGGMDVDGLIEDVVRGAIREVVFGEGTGRSGESPSSGGPPSGPAEPILLPFRGLELQGEDNSVLYAVGNNVNDESDEEKWKDRSAEADDDDDGVYVVEDWSDKAETKGPCGWEVLEKLVHKIQSDLASEHGLASRWPLDEPQGEELTYEDPTVAASKQTQRRWRPRVPFVRLPDDFYDVLEDDLEKGDGDDGGEGEGDEPPSFTDRGLDGISPIFWYEMWGEEDILLPPGARMRSIAVYKRTAPGGGEAESSFYVPTSSDGMELPAGDAKLRARERREEAKAMERMDDDERRAEKEWEEGKARWMEKLGGQNPSGYDETKLPSDDDSSAQEFDVATEVGDVTVEGDAAYSTPWVERDANDLTKMVEESVPDQSDETVVVEDTMADNKQPKGDSLGVPLSSDGERRRDLPSIEDNPVFQRLWKGQSQVTSKGQTSALTLDGTPSTSEAPLPPYPSDPHFVGVWRVVLSPLGTQDAAIDDDPTFKSSDNFVLRVDGQVMGGPVLDARHQHKAAGGRWRMFQAVRKSAEGGERGPPPAPRTRLRIRLLVPPEKDRVLVMEGEVTRLVMPGARDAASSPDGWTIANGGILDGMMQNLDDASPRLGAGGEGLLHCGGEAWVEDANGGGNRRRLGPFSLMKLKSVDRKNLIYTVDVSRAASNADEENESNK